MKKVLIIAIIVTQLFSGMAVTDPTSYTYYMQQLKAMNDQVKGALDQLESLNKLNEIANKANKLIDETGKLIYNPTSQIQGIYDNLMGAIDRFRGVADRVQNLGVAHFLKNYHNPKEPLKGEEFEKFTEEFEALFDNSKDENYKKLNAKVEESIMSGDYEDYLRASANLKEYLKLKEIEKDELKKQSLLAPATYYHDYYLNEDKIEERKKKNETVKKLIGQIEKANDLQKQQQTTNQILIELLDVAMQQYEMQMQFFYASNIMHLDTINNNQDKDKDKVQEGRKKFSSSSEEVVKSKVKENVLNYFDELQGISDRSKNNRLINLKEY